MDSLGIALDGGRFVRIDSRISDLPRNVRLRTLRADQKTARLDFCVFRKEEPKIRRSHRITGLRSAHDSPPELKLKVERRSYAVWDVRIVRTGAPVEELRIRTGIGLWPIVLAAILLASFGFWMLLAGLGVVPAIGPARNAGSSRANPVPSAVHGESAAENEAVEQTPAMESQAASATDNTASSEESDTPPDTGTAESGGTGNGSTGGADGADASIGEAVPDASPSQPRQSSEKVAALIPRPDPVVVYFAPESFRLSDSAMAALNDFAESHPVRGELDITGHCADFGTERGRQALSEARARVVADYLNALLPDTVVIKYRGMGVSDPATRDPSRQHLNRRAAVVSVESDG